MKASDDRPIILEMAFWCWILGGVLLVVGGAMAVFAGSDSMPNNFPGASLSAAQAHSLAFVYRGVGVAAIACGVVIGYLAFKTTRTRTDRYRKFAVGLSLAMLLLTVALGFLFGILVPLSPFALAALLVAALLATRKSATAWFRSTDVGDTGST